MFYGVYGRNGAGVYFRWHRVEDSKPFISGIKCKKFHTLEEAIAFIEYGLTQFYRVVPANKLNADVLYSRQNFFSHIKDLII